MAYNGPAPLPLGSGGTGQTAFGSGTLSSNGSVLTSGAIDLTNTTYVSAGASGTFQSTGSANSFGAPYWGQQGSFNNTLYYARTALTAANIKALNGTPIQVIAAPGANKMIAVHYVAVHYYYVAPAYTAGAAQTIRMIYSTTLGTTIYSTLVSNANLVGTANAISVGPSAQAAAILDTNFINQGVYLINPIATEVTNGNGTLTCYVWYSIVDVTV
jgi:hypothetical protein